MRKKLVIFPFNGNGIEALDAIGEEYEFLGFIDDDTSKKSEKYHVHSREILINNDVFVLAVPGSPATYKTRKHAIDSLNLPAGRFVSLIHPSAQLGKSVRVGYNCLIMAGVVLTSNAVIHNHVCILPNTVIHHDSSIGDYSLVGTNVVVAGGTSIGNNCYIGSGSNIINGITIGDFSLIGIGSNVIRSVEANVKMAGNPARKLDTI